MHWGEGREPPCSPPMAEILAARLWRRHVTLAGCLLAGSVNSKHNISHEFAQFSLNNVTVITKSLSLSIGADEISEDFGGTNYIMFLWYFLFLNLHYSVILEITNRASVELLFK